MGQHIGDFVVTDKAIIQNEVTGTTKAKRGAKLVSFGKLSGGLIVEAGAKAVVFGHVGRNIVNEGSLVLNGRVAGTIVGKGAVVMGLGAHVSGDDLPVEPVSESSAA